MIASLNNAACSALRFAVPETSLRPDLLPCITVTTRYLTGDAARCATLESYASGWRHVDTLGKGATGLRGLLERGSECWQPEHRWTTAAKVSAVLGGLKELAAFGAGALKPFEDGLACASTLIGVVVQIKESGCSLKTAFFVYFKVFSVSKSFFNLIEAVLNEKAFKVLKSGESILFDKRVVVGVSVFSLSVALLRHDNSRLYYALKINVVRSWIFGQEETNG